MGLFHLAFVKQSARVKERRLDIFFFKLWKSLNDVIPRVPAGDLV